MPLANMHLIELTLDDHTGTHRSANGCAIVQLRRRHQVIDAARFANRFFFLSGFTGDSGTTLESFPRASRAARAESRSRLPAWACLAVLPKSGATQESVGRSRLRCRLAAEVGLVQEQALSTILIFFRRGCARENGKRGQSVDADGIGLFPR